MLDCNELMFAGAPPSPSGQAVFTATGTSTWIVPEGVTSICMVAVQPGSGVETPGGTSQITVNGTVVCRAQNGNRIGDGGGDGGRGFTALDGTGIARGGGGAGGYAGNGGDGGSYPGEGSATTGGQAGNGGGGGGGGSSYGNYVGCAGGGVGLLGQGSSGAASAVAGVGRGGSGGADASINTSDPIRLAGLYGGGSPKAQGGALSWKNNVPVTPGQSISISIGSPGQSRVDVDLNRYCTSAAGAVRIIWGAGRSYPYNAANV